MNSGKSCLISLSSVNPHISAELNKPWLVTNEAAHYLGRSIGAVRNMVYRGQLRPRKFYGRLYFEKEELDRLIRFTTQGAL